MNRSEFIAYWVGNSQRTTEEIADLGRGAFPCGCGEDCQGWQMVNAETYAADMTRAREGGDYDPSKGADVESLAGFPEWGPYCQRQGCRGRWWPENDHTLCDLTRWWLAICQDCQPVLPTPFRSLAERDRWAELHGRIGHQVLRTFEDR